MLEVEGHVELGAVVVGVLAGLLDREAGALAHGEQVVVAQHLLAHLAKVLVNVGAVVDVGAEVPEVAAGAELAVWHLGGLAYHADGVHPEAVHALVAPPAHHLEDLLAHGGVVPVEVGLEGAEGVEVVLPRGLVKGPGAAGEHGAPVVRGAAVFAVAPNVEVALRVVAGRAALDEPGVHLRGVVHDEVHNHANAPGVHLGEHAVKVLHRAEAGLDGLVVADIVAVVPAGGAIEGREPDDVHAQLAQVVQAAGDAGKVAYAVAVGVLEAAGVDLVDHALLPPCLFHT